MKPLFLFVGTLVLASAFKTLEEVVGNWTDVTSEVVNGVKLPDKLSPFINKTAVAEFKKKNSSYTEDWVIRDEDVTEAEEEVSESLNRASYDGKKTTITVSSQAGMQLYQHWLDQAVSGLMAAVATKKLRDVEKPEKRAHRVCTKDAKTVHAHAKCVAALLDAPEGKNDVPVVKKALGMKKGKKKFRSSEKKSAERKLKSSERPNKSSERRSWLKSAERITLRKSSKGKLSTSAEKRLKIKKLSSNPKKRKFTKPRRIDYSKSSSMEKNNWTGSFRHKREVASKPAAKGYRIVNKKTYKMASVGQVSPFSLMAKKLTEAVRSFKKADKEQKGWKDTLDEIADEGRKLKKKEKVKKLFRKRMELFSKVMTDAGVDPDAGLDALDLGMFKDDPASEREEAKKEAEEVEKKMTPEQKAMRQPIRLIRDGVKLGLRLAGQNVSDFDDKTLKMISPKIMSLVPDEEDNRNRTVNLLSPSLFSLHNESGPHEHFSLSNIMRTLGKGSEDEWMNFVFEASGVSDAVGYMKQINEKEEREEYAKQKGPNGQPLYFTRENLTQEFGEHEGLRADHMQKLHSMFSQEQFNKLNDTGYVSLTNPQLDFLYGPESPYNNSEALGRLQNLTEEDHKKAIDHTIRSLAREEIAFKAQREKDLVLSPVVLSPIINSPATASQALILSPVLLSPLIQSPAVFGSVILTPWAFVPVILSPRVLGPVVLSPIAFAPIILSPLALVPVILSPGIFLPFILSPFVLTPFILSPVAFAPIILSPFALSPFILVPNLMAPMILSPFVLSPLILSPPAISAFVLNPYALSPVIKSDGFAFTAVLSPSWLS